MDGVIGSDEYQLPYYCLSSLSLFFDFGKTATKVGLRPLMTSLTHRFNSFSIDLCPSLRDRDNLILLMTEKEIECEGAREVN